MSFDLEYYKSRINPAYADRLGSESHERQQLCNEIERLQAENEKLAGEFVEYCLMIAEQDQKAHAEFRAEIDELQKDTERLDWLDKNNETYAITVDIDCFWYIRRKTDKSCVGRPFIRGAIDAAMKRGE